MFAYLIRASISNRLIVVLVSVCLMGYGLYVSSRMPVDVFPDLTAPTVTIMTEAHGMVPTEVETLVTFPIETSMNGAPGVRRVRSSSTLGFSMVWVEFDWETDVAVARQTVIEKLALVQGALPDDVDNPVLAPQASLMGEVMLLALLSESRSDFELRSFAENVIRRRLLAVQGVAQVSTIGGELKQYQVVLSPSRLRAYNLTTADVAKSLSETNQNLSGGVLISGSQEYFIQGLGRIQQLKQIGETVVTVRDKTPILVRDLGDVKIGPALRRGDASSMGKPAVVIAVTKQPLANTLELTERINATLDELSTGLPEGMVLQTDIFQQSRFIEHAIHNVQRALRDGAILVVVIVMLFLWSGRASVITLLAIPLSLLSAVLALRFFGATINTMTLGGMAIAIGELVDDAIVDVENVFRRLRQNAALPEEERKSAFSVVLNGSLEIRSSIVFATAIVVLVFVPLFFLPGVEGRLLQPLAVAYIMSMSASLIVAVTLTPALCYFLLPGSRDLRREQEPPPARLAKRLYAPILDGVLDHPWLVGGGAVVLMVLSAASVFIMGRSFLPQFNEGALTINATALPGTSLEESSRLAAEVERILIRHGEVKSAARQTGRAELAEHTMGVESSEITATLNMKRFLATDDPVKAQEEFLETIRQEFKAVPGVVIEIGQPISHRIDHMLSGTRAAIAINIYAPDDAPNSLQRLRELARQVETAIQPVPGVVDLNVEQQMHVPALKVRFHRDVIARNGLHVSDVGHELERAFSGEVVTQILEGRNPYDLVVRVSEPRKFRVEDVKRLPVKTPLGSTVPLEALAEIDTSLTPNRISRENVQRKIVVSCNIAGRDVGTIVSDIQTRIADNVDIGEGVYAGYYLDLGGQFKTAESAFQLLLVLTFCVVLAIGVLLHIAFRSLGDACLVLLNLPMALIGGVFGVFLSGGVLSIASLVGFITLLGITTRNGIMLVSHIRHLQREEGVTDFREAIRQGAMERLTPILMTALSTGLGLLPLALAGQQPGSEIESPLAVVVLCGLASSTLLNMIVIPTFFLRFAARETALTQNAADSTI